MKKELIISTAISVLIVVGALFSIPPISYFLDLNVFIKDSWIVSEKYEPPFGHAEELSLKVFCEKMEIDLDKAVGELKSKGLKLKSPAQSLTEISILNQTSPMNIYLIIKKFEPVEQNSENKIYTPDLVELEFAGTDIANKTLGALCAYLDTDLTIAQKRLGENGIEISPDEKLKEAAEKHNLASLDLLKIILAEDFKRRNN